MTEMIVFPMGKKNRHHRHDRHGKVCLWNI